MSQNVNDLRYLKNMAPRRWETLNLLAQGLTCEQIADQMGLAMSSVRSALSKMYKTYDAKNNIDLVMMAYKAGILDA